MPTSVALRIRARKSRARSLLHTAKRTVMHSHASCCFHYRRMTATDMTIATLQCVLEASVEKKSVFDG